MKQPGRVVVMGLPALPELKYPHGMTFLNNEGSILENIQAGGRELMRQDPTPRPVLLVSGDAPSIRPEMLDWLATNVENQDAELFYTVIERSVMEARFPGSRRSYVHLKDLDVCGGDVSVLRTDTAIREHPNVNQLIENRKNAIRQAGILGIDLLFTLLLRQLDIEKAEKKISKRLGITGKIVVAPFAELGMDVDKPNQLKLVQNYLAIQKT
jgi:hypothetical protein